MLKNILCHFEVNFKSKDKKQILVDKLKNVIKNVMSRITNDPYKSYNLLFESCCNKQVETLLSLLTKNWLTNFSDVKMKKTLQETYKIHRK